MKGTAGDGPSAMSFDRRQPRGGHRTSSARETSAAGKLEAPDAADLNQATVPNLSAASEGLSAGHPLRSQETRIDSAPRLAGKPDLYFKEVRIVPDPMRQLLLSDLLPIVEGPRGGSSGLPVDNPEAFEMLDAYFASYDPKAEVSGTRVHAESQRRRRDRSFASYWELTRRR